MEVCSWWSTNTSACGWRVFDDLWIKCGWRVFYVDILEDLVKVDAIFIRYFFFQVFNTNFTRFIYDFNIGNEIDSLLIDYEIDCWFFVEGFFSDLFKICFYNLCMDIVDVSTLGLSF